VRDHFRAAPDYQDHLARFLENHDEPRAAAAFARDVHEAAAVITYLSPGLRFFHQGQFEGRTKRISPHLCRAPEEPVDQELARFYAQLLAVLHRPLVRDGAWTLLEPSPAWEGNGSFGDFLTFGWQDPGPDRLLVVVNYAPHASQCYVRLPFDDLGGRGWSLADLTGDATYDREGDELRAKGLYLDLKPWQYHVFELKPSRAADRVESRREPAVVWVGA